MVAGSAAGLTPVMVLHPLDVLKTRLQGQAQPPALLAPPGECRIDFA